MIPYARFAFNWEDAGDLYYNVVDTENTVYKDGSTISGKTVRMLGLPIVASAEDEEAMIGRSNLAYAELHGFNRVVSK